MTSNSYRSKFEQRVCKELSTRTEYGYEPFKINYVVPMRNTYYLPDVVLPNGIIVEIKGLLTTNDRKKYKLLKAQHPEYETRFLFMRNNTISKVSKTTYTAWAEQHGFKCHVGKTVPQEWIDE